MLFSTLKERIQDKGSLALTVSLNSGHTLVHLLTDPHEVVDYLPQPLANSLNLIREGAPLSEAISQLDMHLEPSTVNVGLALDIASECSIVMCELSQTYAVVQHGMFVFYVDDAGNTFTCWSESNDRNSQNCCINTN